MDNISIFITNLGRYNEGVLMGEWVRLPVPADKLEEVLARIGINGEYSLLLCQLAEDLTHEAPVQCPQTDSSEYL